MIDGANRLQVLRLVVLPNILPGVVATTTFAFLLSWGDVLWALCLISDEAKLTDYPRHHPPDRPVSCGMVADHGGDRDRKHRPCRALSLDAALSGSRRRRLGGQGLNRHR